ncbi:MAG: D-alanine--D-alanine ligase family protein [Synechococcus sp.]
MTANRTIVGLVFGGASGEHEVSIRSARTVLAGLSDGENSNRYRVITLYIDREGRWWGDTVAQAVLGNEQPGDPRPTPLPPAGFRGLPAEANDVEIWYPVLHGPNGEDGTVQGLFRLMGQPFVGADVLGSAMAMDKLAMKAAFAAAGLAQVPYIGLTASDLRERTRQDTLLQQIEQELGYPCFVKPANLGSSVGISKARNRQQLKAGLEQAASLDHRIVVEQGVTARELECAVLGRSDALRASVVGEVRFDADWYDYDTKYSEGTSTTLIPAPLPDAIGQALQSQALQACAAVGVDGMARVDFFFDPATSQLWINEINTLPGFTAQSMYPMLWEASGLTLGQLVHELVQTAGE